MIKETGPLLPIWFLLPLKGMALTYVMSSPLNTNSPRKHTEKHEIFINHIDVFREIRCDSVAIDQDQGLSQCHCP